MKISKLKKIALITTVAVAMSAFVFTGCSDDSKDKDDEETKAEETEPEETEAEETEAEETEAEETEAEETEAEETEAEETEEEESIDIDDYEMPEMLTAADFSDERVAQYAQEYIDMGYILFDDTASGYEGIEYVEGFAGISDYENMPEDNTIFSVASVVLFNSYDDAFSYLDENVFSLAEFEQTEAEGGTVYTANEPGMTIVVFFGEDGFVKIDQTVDFSAVSYE